MKKFSIGLVIGILIGIIAFSIILFSAFPKMMLIVDKSKFNYEETYFKLEDSILNHDWDIQRIYDIEGCMQHYGYEDMSKLAIFSFCKPEHVNKILTDDKNKFVSAIMPCRISIYETKEGEVYISRMNISLMSKIFGGTIEEVMAKVAIEEASIVADIIQN